MSTRNIFGAHLEIESRGVSILANSEIYMSKKIGFYS